ncbi:MAG: hypothetical protein JST76_07700 [Bacteroidetes bacterium]|nr:hypothetical protein [Bacteroidota bacterium]
MTFILLPEAQRALTEISDFIDAVNTFGAGERWVEGLIESVESFTRSAEHVTYALCTNEAFASKGLSCSILMTGSLRLKPLMKSLKYIS